MMKKRFTFLLFFLFITGVLQAQIPTDGLVGYWPFNGNANDESGNANDGSVNGATLTTDRFGNQQAAYSFDGLSNFIEIALNAQLETSDITISAWLKTSTIGNLEDGDWMDIVSYGEDAHVMAIDENGYLLGGIQGTDEDCEFSGDVIVATDEWFFVAMTRNNNNITLYINGEEHFTDSCHYSTIFNHAYLNFGRDPSWNEEYFEGNLDDIRMYNRALNLAEIQELYGVQTGIISSNNTYTINVFPNPANNVLSIHLAHQNSNDFNVEIHDLTGRKIFMRNYKSNSFEINTSGLSAGTYLIKLKDSSGNLLNTEKFVKE